jgi:ATP/maltotriose-dependent transcriptional regulator MalT
MTTTATVPEARIRKRRIVERPRLYALLDASSARVRTLVAPAGYGKTTLAEQWVARDGRTAAWYTARSSSTDVAALALGLARSATAIIGGCDHRLREHMRALPAPAENVETLAEILGEDLADWPATAWLVLDDYHEVAQEPRAEDFVAALVAESPVQLLIASRVRPAWVSTKDLLYGDAFELTQAALAMNNDEAACVLVDRSAGAASGLVSLARGWPAVIGLAGISTAEVEADSGTLPDSLYRFFADEVFAALGPEMKQGLTTLSVAPVLDRELVTGLLGVDAAEDVAAQALNLGILVERVNELDLHPLARAFLEERSSQRGMIPALGSGEACLAHYRARRDWDAAFELIVRCRWPEELEALLAAAIDDLLGAARLSTVERWCQFALDADLDTPLVYLARAEVLLRQGCHRDAIANAERAARSEGGGHVYRALSVGGRAAHLASQEELAIDLFKQAEGVAANDNQRQDALWGQLLALIELEKPESDDTLRTLKSTVQEADPRDVVRAATFGLSYQLKLGNLDLDEADFAATLLERVRDPLIRSAFESTYSNALGLAARYQDARRVAEEFAETIKQYRFDFANPYARLAAATAWSGMRCWSRANEHAQAAVSAAVRNRDGHAHQLCTALWIRILAQQGRHHEALGVELPTVREPLPAAEAELLSSRALVLAASGRTQEVRELKYEVRDLSRAVEPAVLTCAVDAIMALKEHDADVIEQVGRLEEVAFERGSVDLLVAAYRSAPELLSVLLRAPTEHDRFRSLVCRVGDQDLATVIGHPIRTGVDPRLTLSRRELEVYELMTQGLTNREIARLLYIEESTTKAHVHHIFDKLGVRSRFALTVQATLERSGQATSATGETSSEGSSEL